MSPAPLFTAGILLVVSPYIYTWCQVQTRPEAQALTYPENRTASGSRCVCKNSMLPRATIEEAVHHICSEGSSIWEPKTSPTQKLIWRKPKLLSYETCPHGLRMYTTIVMHENRPVSDDFGLRSVLSRSENISDENCSYLYRSMRILCCGREHGSCTPGYLLFRRFPAV